MGQTKKPESSGERKAGPGENKSVFGTQLPSFGISSPPQPTTGGMVASTLPPRDTEAAGGIRGTMRAPAANRSPLASIAIGEVSKLSSTEGLRLISQTHRADSSQLKMLSRSASPEQPAMLRDVSAERRPETAAEQRAARPASRKVRDAGRSTWNLRIHTRDITGHMSGVSAAPDSRSAETAGSSGLQAAFIEGDASAEYEVLGELGAGSMGVVYRAKQTSLNRELAIKTLKPTSSCTLHDQEMFVSEAVVTANLVHPNIIPIHDLGRTADGKIFYSMKQVTGVSWDKTLPVRPQEENLDIFMKVCDAVAYAHSRGVINRDLKPENVIVGNYGEVVVLDWGLAVTLDSFEKRNSVLVEFRGCAGTPVYMSPELADEDVRLVGPHSDIYLLGAILFELLEGFPPHFLKRFWYLQDPTEQLNAVIQAVLDNEVEQDVANHGELMQIARKAMSTDPQRRYHSVEALQEAIREYRITGRAEELLQSVQTTGEASYQHYQSAAALYSEALRKWPTNRRAVEGDRKARLEYAKLALQKGDIDLGLQVTADREEPEFVTIRSRLRKSRTLRKIVRATWGVMSVTAVTLLMVVALLYLEADRAKAEAVLAKDEAVRLKDEAVQAKEELERKNGEIEVLEMKEQVLRADAEQLRISSEQLVAGANQKVADAELQLVTAQQNVEKANRDLVAADAQLKAVRTEAEVAKQQVESARMQAQLALAQAETARRDSFLSQLRGFEIRIKAYEELGEYGRVIQVAEEALQQADQNPVIDANKRKVFEEQIREFRRRLDNAEARLDQKPAVAVVSTDGSTIAAYCRGGQPGIHILRGDPRVTQLQEFSRVFLEASRGLVRHLAISADGNWICLTGKNIKQLWQWQTTGYREVSLPQTFPRSRRGLNSETFSKSLFSSNNRHLYLIGADDNATVEIYALLDGTPALRLQKTLSGDSSGGFPLRDAVLLPDESALIAQTAEFGCLTFRLHWDQDTPAFGSLHVRAPRLAGLDDSRISRAIYDPSRLVLSPDGQQLALISGKTVLVLPRKVQVADDAFPFASPNDLTELQLFQTTFTINDLAFSSDNRRIAAGDNKRYIQLWDLSNGTYQPCPAAGLYSHQKNAARSLRGHSEAIQALCFQGQSADSLISVGSDSAVRAWQISTYADYVDDFRQLRSLLPPDEQSTAETANLDRPADEVSLQSPTKNFRWSRLVSPVLASTHAVSTALVQGETEAAEVEKPSTIKTGRRIYSARFSPDARRVLLGTDDLAAHMFDSRTGAPVMHDSTEGRKELFFDPEGNNFLEGHISEIASLRFLPPTGDLLLSADYFGSISAWDAVADDDGIAYEKCRLLSEYSFSEFTTSDDGRLILAGGAVTDHQVPLEEAGLSHIGVLWRTEEISSGPTPKPFRLLEGQHSRFAITSVALSPSGRLAMTAGRRGRIVIWNLEDGSVVAVAAESHGRDQVSGAFFRSESQLITVGYDGRIFDWEIVGETLKSTEIQRKTAGGVPEFIIRLRPSPDRSQFITSEVMTAREGPSKQRFLKFSVWKDGTDRPLLSEPILIPDQDKGKAFRQDVSWSSDGSELLVVIDGVISLYSTSDWSLIRRFRQNFGGIKAVRGSFAPVAPGRPSRIATFDGRFTHLWDLKTGERLAEFRSHSTLNVTAEFSPDARYVITGSESIRVFDAEEQNPQFGRTMFRFPIREAHPGILSDVRFCPRQDQGLLASIDRHGGLKLWDWRPTEKTPLREMFSDVPKVQSAPPEWTEGFATGNVVGWSVDGNWLAAVQNGQLRLWSAQQRQLKPVDVPLPPGQSFRFNQVDFGNANLLCAGGVAFQEETGELRSCGIVWRISSEANVEVVATIQDAHPVELQSASSLTGVTAISFDDFRNEILTGGADGELIRWQIGELSSGEFRELDRIARKSVSAGTEPPHEWPISAIDIAADGRIVSADINGNAILWPADAAP